MTEHERNKRRAMIVRRHRVYLRAHGDLEPIRRRVRSEESDDESIERSGYEDPLDVLPDLG